MLKEYEYVSPAGAPVNTINRNMAEIIEQDILMSAALFVILSETVERLPNTAQWIIYESALANSKKPVWVFEPYEAHGRVRVTIPHFDHFVRFEQRDETRGYIHKIVASHDDVPLLLTSGGALGGAVLTASFWGLLAGGVVGYLLARKTEPPKGFQFTCDGCFVSYQVHLPGGRGGFRCAACNKLWRLT